MKIDIQKRYSFKHYDDLIIYMIDNGYELEHGDLWHIFNNMYKTKSLKYNRLGMAIIYLLDELKGEKRERLVDLLNKSFDYAYAFKYYSYRCNNALVAKYLIQLEKQLRHNKKNEALDEFKSLF